MDKELGCRHCGASWAWDWEHCPQCNRNYAGAIYPEIKTDAQRGDALEVITEIEKAFALVELEGGMTLHEADLEGCYLDGQERLAARAKDQERRWQEIPPEKIAPFQSVIGFFDPVGWRFHLPAFMIWTINHWQETRFITGDSVISSLSFTFPSIDSPRYELLTTDQARAVCRFLEFIDEYDPDDDARTAIDAYWYRFRSDGGTSPLFG